MINKLKSMIKETFLNNVPHDEDPMESHSHDMIDEMIDSIGDDEVLPITIIHNGGKEDERLKCSRNSGEERTS